MSLAHTAHSTHRTTIKRSLPSVGMGLCLAVLAAHLAWDIVSWRTSAAEAQAQVRRAQAALSQQTAPASPATTAVLSDAKLQAAKLTTAQARYDELSMELAVPGRIEVNADRRIDIRPRAAGVVREVHALLGQNVKRGDPLVTLDSPDVGTARLNLRARQRELNTTRIEADWKSKVAAAVMLLIPEIRNGTDPAMIEREFAD